MGVGRAGGGARGRARAAPVGHQAGLPYVYNIDEADHFVPHAVAMFGAQPEPPLLRQPARLHLSAALPLRVVVRRARGVSHALARATRRDVFTLARVAAALLGTLAVWLLYVAGARLFDRGVGLLAAALEAVAFLPVFYAQLALNDVPDARAADARRCWAAAGVLRNGRARDYAIAGVGARPRVRDQVHGRDRARRRSSAAIVPRELPHGSAGRAAGARSAGSRSPASAALAAFLIANPYCAARLPARFNAELGPPVERCPPKPRASSARHTRAACSTTCGRSPGGSAGCRRSRRSAAR